MNILIYILSPIIISFSHTNADTSTPTPNADGTTTTSTVSLATQDGYSVVKKRPPEPQAAFLPAKPADSCSDLKSCRKCVGTEGCGYCTEGKGSILGSSDSIHIFRPMHICKNVLSGFHSAGQRHSVL